MLASLGGRLFRQAFAAENTPEDMRAYLAEHFTEAALQSVLRDPELHTLVLEDGGTPVGWALLASGRSATRAAAGGASTTTGGEMEIRRFYVDGRLYGSAAAPALLASARTCRPTTCCSAPRRSG